MIERTFMTAREAAAYLGFQLNYLYTKCSKKQIPYYKPENGGKRGKLYFKQEELDRWIAAGRVATDAEILAKANNFPTH